jgi:hypothetical protein
LNSPKAPVVTGLQIGEVLDVEFDPSGKSVIAKKNANVAGSLTPFRLAELIECMNRGRKYKAIVKKVSGGYCEVEIRPK